MHRQIKGRCTPRGLSREKESPEMLERLLEGKKPEILKKWRDSLIDTYPLDARRFLSRFDDQFGNPVGYTIARAIEVFCDELLGEFKPEVFASQLDEIVRIRAVQDFSPAQAIGFIFNLKRIVREQIEEELSSEEIKELYELDSRIDALALMAFNKYVECREKVYDVRLNEMRNLSMKMIERMNAKKELWQKEGRLKKE